MFPRPLRRDPSSALLGAGSAAVGAGGLLGLLSNKPVLEKHRDAVFRDTMWMDGEVKVRGETGCGCDCDNGSGNDNLSM
jgi:hypothetical protein